MNADTTATDILRRQFPDPEARRGVRLLRRLGAKVLAPVQQDRRLLVYPVAVVMAVGIGLLGHALAPVDAASSGPDVAVSSSAPIADSEHDVRPADQPSVPTSDGDPADPSPRTR